MIKLGIVCDEYDFSPLAQAFADEFDCDAPVAAEVVIVGKDEIRELNSRFRSIDKVTDVLSFPALDGIYKKKIEGKSFPFDMEDGVLNAGSIAVCKEVAAEQAEEYGHSFERELNYLVTHGVCHLFGYDHMTDADKSEMRAKEEKVLSKLNLTRD